MSEAEDLIHATDTERSEEIKRLWDGYYGVLACLGVMLMSGYISYEKYQDLVARLEAACNETACQFAQ